jgi:hypothetical protein
MADWLCTYSIDTSAQPNFSVFMLRSIIERDLADILSHDWQGLRNIR